MGCIANCHGQITIKQLEAHSAGADMEAHNEYELDEESNEAHDNETNGCPRADLGVLCRGRVPLSEIASPFPKQHGSCCRLDYLSCQASCIF